MANVFLEVFFLILPAILSSIVLSLLKKQNFVLLFLSLLVSSKFKNIFTDMVEIYNTSV